MQAGPQQDRNHRNIGSRKGRHLGKICESQGAWSSLGSQDDHLTAMPTRLHKNRKVRFLHFSFDVFLYTLLDANGRFLQSRGHVSAGCVERTKRKRLQWTSGILTRRCLFSATVVSASTGVFKQQKLWAIRLAGQRA